jgi:hypothetical protein
MTKKNSERVSEELRLRGQIESLRKEQAGLRKTVYVQVGLLTGLVIIIGALGLLRYLNVVAFADVKQSVGSVLMAQLTSQSRQVIDRLTLYAQPQQQVKAINDLVDLRNLTDDVRPRDTEFRHISELVDILTVAFIDNDKPEALRLSDRLILQAQEGSFVNVRAHALRALFVFHRDWRNPERSILQDLQITIDKDGSIPIIFNLMGIMMAYEARAKVKAGDYDEAAGFFMDAMHHLSFGRNLDATAMGTHKLLNNRAWARMLFLNSFLAVGCKISDIDVKMKLIGMNGADQLFVMSADDLRLDETVCPGRSIGTETEAQMLSTKARYLRACGKIDRANHYRQRAVECLIRALEEGLAGTVLAEATSLEGAIAKFWEDPLLHEIANHPASREKIETAIRREHKAVS